MNLNLDTEENKQLATWGLIGVCAIAVFLRFWGLERFNVFVFDEVYYAKFANNYLTNTKFFNSHPPLSQYLIAIGIWIGDRLPIGRDNVNELTVSLRSTFSYRWMNALFGSFIPPLVAALAYQLNQRLSYAFLAALFISLDGLFLIDSRYALNNIFLVFFGILGQLLVLMAGRAMPSRRLLLLVVAGVSFGASAACKWNGLWFLFGFYILIFIARIWKVLKVDRQFSILTNTLLDRLANLPLIELFLSTIFVPIAVYSLLWIPHLIQNPTPNFIDVQLAILNYHKEIGNGAGVHPYCANWYTWPLLMRPLAYYFTEYKDDYFYDVHAMGNPLLWWLALGAVFGSIWVVIARVRSTIKLFNIERVTQVPIEGINLNYISIPLFISINYAANLLPWVRVTRCLYIYHYMGAILFAIMGLAWFVDIWLRSNSKLLQALGITTIFGVAASFVFWLPIFLGLPIERTALSLRLWDFWIFNWI